MGEPKALICPDRKTVEILRQHQSSVLSEQSAVERGHTCME